MIGELLGEILSEVVGEAFGRFFPERVPGWVVLACCALSAGVMWASARWWQADPASDTRTGVAVLSWIFMPTITIVLALQYDAGVHERRRLRRESAGLGALRNDRLRAR